MNYYLIGKKLPYSYSYVIHKYFKNDNYLIKELEEKELPSFIRSLEFKGLNVTIPYKKTLIKYLNEKDDVVLNINVLNTIVNDKGVLKGYNTDYLGFKETIDHYDVKIKDQNVLILGTGASSSTITYFLRQNEVRNIYYASTSNEIYSYDKIDSFKDNIDIIINTTPYNTYPSNNESSLISLDGFTNLKVVIDLIYNPFNTRLLLDAKNKGIKAINGLYMLVAQAFYSECLFKNKKLNHKLINKVYNKVLLANINICLIGMPSSGKTTISKKLANKLNRGLIDSDLLIEQRLNMPIAKYLNKDNEIDFRKLESSIISNLKDEKGKIISTGGGVILNPSNIDNLRQNGIIIFIDKPFDKLFASDDRPLSNNKDDLKKLYDERYELYKKSSDYVISSSNDAIILKDIIKLLKRF